MADKQRITLGPKDAAWIVPEKGEMRPVSRSTARMLKFRKTRCY